MVKPQCLAQGNERQTPGGNDMSCERCGGLMVIETICDLVEDNYLRGIETARCVNCGNFEDSRIRTNRASSRLPEQVEPRTVGSRRPSVIHPRALERATQTDGVFGKSPRGRTPRLPVAPPLAKTRRLEPVYIEQPTRIIQPKGESHEYRTVVSADNRVGGRRESATERVRTQI
jgi:hypothetical protein